MRKGEVREAARRFGLPNCDKPDSQQICFVPDGDHRGFLEARGGAGPAGSVVDEGGRVLAAHAGTHHFTVGQRRGLPAGAEKRFVVRIDPATGTVFTGPRDQLGRRVMSVEDVRWLEAPGEERVRAEVQIRHHSPARPAWLTVGEGVEVEFDEPTEGVAPGQAAVFFRGEQVLGGGWIA
jgi:tRNA-specific 2-thiouridylase